MVVKDDKQHLHAGDGDDLVHMNGSRLMTCTAALGQRSHVVEYKSSPFKARSRQHDVLHSRVHECSSGLMSAVGCSVGTPPLIHTGNGRIFMFWALCTYGF